MSKLTTIALLLVLSLLGGIAAASPCIKALAAPRVGTIQFGTHMDKDSLDVYPVQTRFPAGKAPFYAASLRHPARTTYVTVALSVRFGDGTELKALEHDYVDLGDDTLMGWLPKETLRPGFYILTIRTDSYELASGSFRVVGAHSVRSGK